MYCGVPTRVPGRVSAAAVSPSSRTPKTPLRAGQPDPDHTAPENRRFTRPACRANMSLFGLRPQQQPDTYGRTEISLEARGVLLLLTNRPDDLLLIRKLQMD